MTGHIKLLRPNVREQLLDKGLQVLHERGFNATSVQDITEAAGVPKGSFYKYFEGLVQVAEKKEFCGGCLLGNFGAELSEQSEIIRARVSKEFSTWSAMIANVIAEAQAEGQISKDLPASTLAAFVLNGWEGALVRARVDKSKAPLE